MAHQITHCPFCGQPAAETDKTCRYCRYDLTRAQTSDDATPLRIPDDGEPIPANHLSRRKLIGRLVTAVLAASLVGGWYWNRSRPTFVPQRDAGPNLLTQITSTTSSIEPFTTPAGHPVRAVTVTLYNAGPKPIREVWGKVTVFAEGGIHTPDGYEHACIFPHTGSAMVGMSIQPGKSMTLPGIAIIDSDRSSDIRATSVDVQLTEAYENYDANRYTP